MRKTFFLLLSVISIECFSQAAKDSAFRNEFSVLTDNDIFFFRDYYYSAGQELMFRRSLKSQNLWHRTIAKSDTTKVLIVTKVGIKVFTPKEISQTDIKKMDRPYAGVDYLSLGVIRFDKLDRGYSFSIDLGFVGKSTGLGQFQSWWHKVLDLRAPRGWNSQINDALVVNINYKYWKSWRLHKKLDLVGISSIYAGTGSNRVSQDLTFRVLDFNSLKNSNFAGSILSSETLKPNELFFFAGVGVDYVASNIFIEGSLFNKKESPFVLDALPFIFRQHFGLMYSTHKWSYSSTMHHLSKEVAGGIDHYYGSLAIGFRF